MSYKPFTTKYTRQIIDDIKEYLEETNKDQTTLDTLDLCHLIGEIEELNNIINELEKYIIYFKEDYEKNRFQPNAKVYIYWKDLIDKLQELKGSDKDE